MQQKKKEKENERDGKRHDFGVSKLFYIEEEHREIIDVIISQKKVGFLTHKKC